MRTLGAFAGLALALAVIGHGHANSGKAGAAAGQHGEARTVPYREPDCKRPKDANEANYCVQRRGSEASEEQAKWGLGQVFVGVAGLAGLLATVLYARAAWKAAQGTLDHNKAATQQQLRAYVGMDGGHLRNFDGAKSMQAQLRFKNAGTTPAYNVRLRGGMFIADHPNGTMLFKDLADHRQPPKMVLPGGLFSKTESGRPPPEMLVKLLDGRAVVFVYGFITYDDAFGVQHHTNYRLFCGGGHPNWLTEKDGERVGQMAPADEGNEAD